MIYKKIISCLKKTDTPPGTGGEKGGVEYAHSTLLLYYVLSDTPKSLKNNKKIKI